jgi:flagellar hook-associated protein 3 FlgL
MTFIPTTTRGFYDRSQSAMSRLNADAVRLTTQISTGSRLLAPSDDSVGWQRLQGLAQASADAVVDERNLDLAASVLAQAETALDQISQQLQRAFELATQAGNGTLSDEARSAIGTELSGILDSIVTLANTRDARGAPLFGGQGDGAAVTPGAGGTLAFAAGEASAIPIGDGQSVEASTNARRFLALPDGTDVGATITAMVAALSAGEALPAGTADDLKAIGDQTIQAQAAVGARAARVELVGAQFAQAATDREATRSGIEDVDLSQAITDLQKTMTVLQATQASFSKLSSLSLFDYLR